MAEMQRAVPSPRVPIHAVTPRGFPAASCHRCEGKGLMRRRHLRRRLWLVPLCASVMTLTTAVGPITSSSADTITIAGCNSRTNNSLAKLLECIRTDDLWKQMKAQQAIADSHPDAGGHASRNSGEPGYKAAVDLAVKVFRAAGYHVTVQTYQ